MSGDNKRAGITLESILKAAPFRLAIESADGRELYASRERRDEFSYRQFPVDIDSQNLSVVIGYDAAADEAERQQLIRRAYFDDVTGLPNRLVAERSVDALIADGETPFALAVIGLDGFGTVNDFFGYANGDELLAKLAERMAGELRESDLLARFRGDEFLLLLAPAASGEEARRRLAQVLERVRMPLFVDHREVFASASAGISLFPDHGRDYTTLQSNASRAMLRSKSDKRGTVSLFDADMQRKAVERGRTEQRLREAIFDRRIICAYQPKVELRSGETRGVEVLMRWIDEDGVMQTPGQFLAIASEVGLMDQLTDMIFEETISSVDLINDAFGEDISISVNIAARQAGNQTFMGELAERLNATGMAERFMLEVTEDAFMATRDFQESILPMIRATGAKVSIDDFGTGYSSLSALADITVDEIKIDRSFITDVHKRPRSQSVLKAIEALGHSLGLSITAEGVETRDELIYLQSMTRIHLAQGHYYSKAVPLRKIDGQPITPRSERVAPVVRMASSGRG